MLHRHRQLRQSVHRGLDPALFVLAFWLAHLVRDSLPWARVVGWLPVAGTKIAQKLSDPILPFSEYTWIYFLIVPLVAFLLEQQGFYQRPILCSRRQTVWMLAKSSVLATMVVILAIFVFRNHDIIARSVIILFGFIGFFLVWLKEELVQWSYRTNAGWAQVKMRLLLLGAPQDTARLKQEVLQKSQGIIEIVAELDLNKTSVEELVHFLHEHSVNGVVISARHIYFGEVEKAVQACELEGVEAWLVADFFQTQLSRTSLDDFMGRPVVVFRTGPEASWQGAAKQVLDYVGALVALLLFSWNLYLLVALAIRLSSRGPVLFRQQRSGLNGQPFMMYKFRTMVENAEDLKSGLADKNEMTGPVFKVTNDPRVTRVGQFLRKYSLDELPQIFNVLRGDMSLVGPRPLPVDEVKRISDFAHRRRLSVKPGVTCLWQISGRNEVNDFSDWVRLDLEYIDNWSFWLDLKILLRTLPAVLLAKGAK